MGNASLHLEDGGPCHLCTHYGGSAHAKPPYVFCRAPGGAGTFQGDPAAGCRRWERGPERVGKRVIVCGGRDWTDRERTYRALDAAHAKSPIVVVVQGGAPGADTLARQWAVDRGVLCDEFSADWHGLGPKAGPVRNQAMVDAGADALIAMPGGRGTADAARRAIAARIVVWKPFG